MIKLYLFDIEGTTTDINFVHKVLFPYATQHLEQFVLKNEDRVSEAIQKVRETVSNEEQKQLNLNGVIQKLLAWIKEDRKHPALKEIQGLIWDEGYSNNQFKGHVYPDVAPFFKKILNSGSKVGIYSSGSVHAQKLIFGYSIEGDLTPLIAYFFDTKVGPKREKSSYLKIANETGLAPSEIHFFSDIPQELEAAKEAGMIITHVQRPGTSRSDFSFVTDFGNL